MVNWHQFLNGFQLDYNLAVYKEVNPISAVEADISVMNREILLPFDSKTPICQLICKAGLIGRLQQPRAKLTMNSDCRTYDRLCKRIMP